MYNTVAKIVIIGPMHKGAIERMNDYISAGQVQRDSQPDCSLGVLYVLCNTVANILQ